MLKGSKEGHLSKLLNEGADVLSDLGPAIGAPSWSRSTPSRKLSASCPVADAPPALLFPELKLLRMVQPFTHQPPFTPLRTCSFSHLGEFTKTLPGVTPFSRELFLLMSDQSLPTRSNRS